MNIYLELLFVLCRAVLIAGGTLAVRHGWISEAAAVHFSGTAAVWLAVGLFLVFGSVAQSAWSKIRQAAFSHIALVLPPGMTSSDVSRVMTQLARRSFWYLAKELTRQMSGNEKAALGSALSTLTLEEPAK